MADQVRQRQSVWSEVRAGFPLKYGWWWRRRFYSPAMRAYWSLRCRVRIGGEGGSMVPKLGPGKFVSLKQRGPILDMVAGETRIGQRGEVIRLVPYQPNHGVMVECWRDGQMAWRSHCSMDDFRRVGVGESAVAKLHSYEHGLSDEEDEAFLIGARAGYDAALGGETDENVGERAARAYGPRQRGYPNEHLHRMKANRRECFIEGYLAALSDHPEPPSEREKHQCPVCLHAMRLHGPSGCSEFCACERTSSAEPLQDGGEREAQDKLIERVRAALRPLGYAVAVHGSRERDLDLIAAPWIEEAEHEPMAVYRALRAAGFREVGVGAIASPHCRLGFAIHGVGSAGVEYIDLSVLFPSRHPHQDVEPDPSPCLTAALEAHREERER